MTVVNEFIRAVSDNFIFYKCWRRICHLWNITLFATWTYPFHLNSFLAKRGVKEEIQTFDARKISPEIRISVEKLLKANKDSFDPKVSYLFSVTLVIYVTQRYIIP